MKLAAITGSIGCGKTTLAKIVRQLGYPVFDADAWVRRMYFNRSFIKTIAEHFPQTVKDGVVNKRLLRNIVFNNKEQLKLLESLTHPFLRDYMKYTIRKYAKVQGWFFIDVALLFEMNWDMFCDFIIVADVDYEIQKQRVMLRDNVSADDFDKINNVQMDNKAKVKLADVVINTDKPQNLLRSELINIISGLEMSDD